MLSMLSDCIGWHIFLDQGQGGAQSIEDGAALGAVLTGLETNDLQAIKERLDAYQTIRRKRASAIQIFSNAGQDEAEQIKADAQQYVDGEVPSTWNPSLWVSSVKCQQSGARRPVRALTGCNTNYFSS